MNNEPHPVVHDTPIGIDATGTRRETDSMGEIEVPADHYWGAQTQRSRSCISRSATTACRSASITPTAT